MLGQVTQNLTGQCPDFDALDAAGVTYDISTFTGINLLCYQKYLNPGLATTDYAPGNLATWEQMINPQLQNQAVWQGSANAQYTQAVANIQNNPSSLNVPQPGTTPVQPTVGIFSQLFDALVKGGTPVAKAEIAMQMQQSMAAKQPLHIPTPILQNMGQPTGLSSSTKKLIWIGVGAVAVAVAVYWFSRSGKKKK